MNFVPRTTMFDPYLYLYLCAANISRRLLYLGLSACGLFLQRICIFNISHCIWLYLYLCVCSPYFTGAMLVLKEQSGLGLIRQRIPPTLWHRSPPRVQGRSPPASPTRRPPASLTRSPPGSPPRVQGRSSTRTPPRSPTRT